MVRGPEEMPMLATHGNYPSFLIVDDHPLFLEALQLTLAHGYPHSRIEVAESCDCADEKLAQEKFDLVLLDLRMPDVCGFDGVHRIKANAPMSQLAVISAADGVDTVNKAKSSGANGFICKNQSRASILDSVSQLLNGEASFPAAQKLSHGDDPEPQAVIEKLRQLTPQQLKVLTHICEAKLNKQIAFELNVTETTIKAHITLIFRKLGVHSRTQALLLMQRIKSNLPNSEFAALAFAKS